MPVGLNRLQRLTRPFVRSTAIGRMVCVMMAVAAVFPGDPARGGDSGLYETDAVAIRYDDSLLGVAKETANAFPAVLKGLEERLRWNLGYRPTVWIVRDRKAFFERGGERLSVAFAVPARGLIVIDNSRVRADPFRLEPTLAHELAHLLLHAHIPDRNLPRWLDEGVAQWASGGTAEIALMEDAGPRLKQAVLLGRWVPFRDLALDFPPDDPALSLAYEQSRSLVDDIVRRYGTGALLRILDGLESGKTIDAAVDEALPVSLAELEADWRDGLKRRVTWVSYLSDRLPLLLFVLAAVLTILGFVRLWIRRRNYKDPDTDEFHSG
jgi:Peptidase MA superfamily